MDENGAQESGMDFYVLFNSLKALEKKFILMYPLTFFEFEFITISLMFRR